MKRLNSSNLFLKLTTNKNSNKKKIVIKYGLIIKTKKMYISFYYGSELL